MGKGQAPCGSYLNALRRKGVNVSVSMNKDADGEFGMTARSAFCVNHQQNCLEAGSGRRSNAQ
jgi:hypothetical protein